MKNYELRSDTFTKPTEPMRKAMYEAEVGDDVYAEDRSVNKLQEKSSELTGKEASLFVPSGSMANLLSLYILGGRGNEVLMHEQAHTIHHEVGGAAAIAGCMPISVPGDKGIMRSAVMAPLLKKDDYDIAHTSLIEIENTHNFAGGTYWREEDLKDVRTFADANSLKVHMDGARLFNAVTASGLTASQISSYTDSVTFCLSKGLGAPVGSMLCGTKEFIHQAKVVRKMLGGGMRQAGIIAAAGIYALENNVERLKEDHLNCRKLAETLNSLSLFTVDLTKVETNIVFAYTEAGKAASINNKLAAKGIRAIATASNEIRFVTSLMISNEEIDEVCRFLKEI
ncbi:MAG: low specificity L-threonine aldolase [Spirochaetaceae bacterium]|jgi:threonine aldolase|nr:low specificity L-threonine aldolase [Spirochaetaceae bacterium]